ncbi:hypothetical protein NDK50_12920 [Paraburkholderia bryophila]|uniref:hypothetical protein n=1 Tax=Paraburkholderia bryophila TaxID=420952 RepID=UPI002349F06D|nr:hypothetical protein [Paraburkholderia bryophila]WCM18358.1 hypothetical protein NDK50_12920 [Paraburkholderia bryophila]
MSNGELIERLRLGAVDCGQKSMTARLTAVIDLVEALMARGYDRSQVREWLIEAGWRFTPDSFDSALSRIRKRRSTAVTQTEDAHGLVKGGWKLMDEAGLPASADNGARVGGAELGGNEAGLMPFAEIFTERDDFTAGRRWK